MKEFLIFILVISFLTCLSAKDNNKAKNYLKITSFSENSVFLEAGAKIDDVIIKYDKQSITTLDELILAKNNAKKDMIEVLVLRDGHQLSLKVPKGKLGIMIKEYAPDHEISKDSKVIEGYKHLDWINGTSNTFLACVALLEENIGSKTDYTDLVGLSGYGFRIQVLSGLCPSAPDACCGKNIGEDILTTLGYSYKYLNLSNLDSISDHCTIQNNSELKNLVKNSIQLGYPLLALNLIDTPEWGLITGYQNDCTQFWCRTFYDKTDGYEIAQNQPWDVYAIQKVKTPNFENAYNKSLKIALEMYETSEYNGYHSGIEAYRFWIEQLSNEKAFKEMSKENFADARHGNWWTYMSLIEARQYCASYLNTNRLRFGVDPAKIEALEQIYIEETNLLKEHLNEIPSNFDSKPRLWFQEDRNIEIQVLKSILELEKKALEILKNI